MNELKEAFLELIKEISENLAGSMNLGLNSADEFHDRLDFLLAYIMLGFSASYGMREYSMYQVIHNEYVRKLAEQEEAMEFDETKTLILTKKENDFSELEGDSKEGGEEGVTQASLDESLAAEAIAIAQVISTTTAFSVGALSTVSRPAAASSSNNNFSPTTEETASTDYNQQLIDTITAMANSLTINEDDASFSVNFFTIAQSLGFDISDTNFNATFDALFNGADSYIPPHNTAFEITAYRVELDLDNDGTPDVSRGDFVWSPLPEGQALRSGEIGIDQYRISAPSIGLAEFTVNVPVSGRNDVPVPPPRPPRMIDDNAASEEITYADILGNTTDADSGAELIIENVIVDRLEDQAVSIASLLNGSTVTINSVTVSDTGITIDPSFYNSLAVGDAAITVNVQFDVSDGEDKARFSADFVIDPANDAPVALDGAVSQIDPTPSITTDQTQHTFSSADFNGSDVDSGTSLSVIIDSLPGFGLLSTPAGAVTAGQVISFTDLDTGILTHTTVASLNGTTSFLFRVTDGTEFSEQRTQIITIHNDAPLVSWNGFTTLPTFFVDGFTFDDPIDNSLLPLKNNSTIGALADQIDLQHYILDQEENLTFSYTNLPSWITTATRAGSLGTVNSILQETTPGATPIPTFLATPQTITIGITITDNAGAVLSLPTALSITSYRLDFDVSAGSPQNNAGGVVGTGGTVTSTLFPTTNDTDGTQAGIIYILNAAGTDLTTLGNTIDWAISGGLYQITAGTGATSSTAFFDSSVFPIPTPGTVTNYKVRIGTNTDSLATTFYRGALGSNDSITGETLILAANSLNIFHAFDGPDMIFGDSIQTSTTTYAIQVINAGAGNDTVFGDNSADFLSNRTGAADLIRGQAGMDILVGDALGANGSNITGGNDTIEGGDDADDIYGDFQNTANNATVQGGADTLSGEGGDDIIRGDGGLGSWFGRGGIDTINGGLGNDTIYGEIEGRFAPGATAAADILNGNAGDDTIIGESGGNFDATGVTGGADIINGGAGMDTLVGETNAIFLRGIGGADTINGGDDADTIFGDSTLNFSVGVLGGNDTLNGDAGDDRIVGDAGTTIDAFFAFGISQGGDDTINGGAGADVLIGDADGNITGIAGADTISGGSGNDTIYGDTDAAFDNTFGFAQAGNDPQLNGDDGNDTIVGDSLFTIPTGFTGGNDVINGGAGIDFLTGDSSSGISGTGGMDTINGDADNDFIYGDTRLQFNSGAIGGIDTLNGGTGVDSIFGESGNQFNGNNTGAGDIISGGDGDDTLVGEGSSSTGSNVTAGNDTINGDAGNDTIFGDFQVVFTGGATAIGGADTLNGGLGNDTIAGENGNLFIAVGGIDTINGGEGNDTIFGETSGLFGNAAVAAGDILNGDAGDDIITGDGFTFSTGTGGNDTIDGGADNDTIYGDGQSFITAGSGSGGNDTLIGGAGNDTIYTDSPSTNYGTKGVDTVFGGLGNDTLFGGRGATALTSAVDLAASNRFRYDISIDNGQDTISNLLTNQQALAAGRGILTLFNAPGETYIDLVDTLFVDISGTNYVFLLNDGGTNSDITFNATTAFDITSNGNRIPIELDSDGTATLIEAGLTPNGTFGTAGTPVAIAMGAPPGLQFTSTDFIFLSGDTGGTADDFVAGDQVGGFGGVATVQRISGGVGNDTLWGETDGDLSGTAANDFLFGDIGTDSLFGDAGGNLLVAATPGNDTLLGGDGDDSIFGDVGGTIPVGGVAGNDVIYGGQGNDSLFGDSGGVNSGTDGSDIFVYNFDSNFRNGSDTINDFDLFNDGSVGDDTIRILNGSNASNNASGPLIEDLTVDITIKNTGPGSSTTVAGIAGNPLFVDFGAPGGILPLDTAVLSNVTAGMVTREFLFESIDANGNSSSFNVLAGEANGLGFINDTDTTNNRLVIDSLSTSGTTTATSYSFDLSTAATPTKTISFFDSANHGLLLDVSGAISTVAFHTEVRDSLLYDVNGNGTNDVYVDVFDGGGALTGTLLLGGVDFNGGIGTELADYGIGSVAII